MDTGTNHYNAPRGVIPLRAPTLSPGPSNLSESSTSLYHRRTSGSIFLHIDQPTYNKHRYDAWRYNGPSAVDTENASFDMLMQAPYNTPAHSIVGHNIDALNNMERAAKRPEYMRSDSSAIYDMHMNIVDREYPRQRTALACDKCRSRKAKVSVPTFSFFSLF